MKIKMTKGEFVLSLSLLMAIGLVAPDAGGQLHIQITPQIFERVISPGGTLNDRLTFHNAGSVPLEVSLELADFDADEGGNSVKFPPATKAYSLAPYLRVTPIRAQIEPGQSLDYRLVAKLPADFDHRRVMLYFLSKPVFEDAGEGSRTIVVPKIGIPVYVESRTASAAVLGVENVEWRRLDDSRLGLTLTTTNAGQRIIRPPVSLEISSADGSFYEVFNLNGGADPVLPGRHRHWAFAVGPVPGGELSARLNFATSLRDSFVRDYEIPAAVVTEAQ